MISDAETKLQKLAMEDWAEFVVVIGKATLIAAKVRILRKEGKSYNQIAAKLGITESQVRYACSKKDDKI